MFIIIRFYTDKINKVICSDFESAHSVCESLELNLQVTQWNTDMGLHSVPWYQEGLWDKLKDDFNDWEF